MKRCSACSNVCLPTQAFCSACGASLSEAAQIVGDPYIGTVLGGRYRVVKKLGEGGMGAVYRAEVLEVGHTVAVKLLHERFAGDATALKRFEREAHVASRLDHPNSIAILDFGTSASGASYLVMEYLKGVSLDAVLVAEPLSVGQSIQIIRQVLAVLEVAHALSIVHRDLKPANIFLVDQGRGYNHVKVLDFGIARLRRDGGSRVTRTGMVCGTPEYMSPEQARGFELDARSDLYAAGIVLYELLTGRRPFEGMSPAEVMSAQISDTPVAPSLRAPDRNIPPSLDAIVLWALSKAPEDRLPSAVEFLKVVDTWAKVTETDESTPVRLRCSGCDASYLPGVDHCPECGIEVRRAEPLTDSVELISADVLEQRGSVAPATATDDGGSLRTAHLHSSSRVNQVESGWFDIPMPTTVPLVGHQDLLAELEAELVRPGLQLLRFVGPPGSGRRRVAGTLLGRIASEGRRGILVQPDPWEMAEPLGAVQRASTELLDMPCEPMVLEDLAEAVQPRNFAEAHLYGLADLFNLGKPGGLGIDERRVLRAEAWRELVLTEAQRRPTALFFEDFDRLDGASRELVQSLSTSDTNANLAIILSHRPEFVALWPPGFREITLGGLSSAETEELALELCDGELEDDEITWLAQRSGGNPLHLIQLLAFFRNNRVSEPPRGLADVIAVRMNALPSEMRAVLQVAAVIGDAVIPEVIMEISTLGSVARQAMTALVSRTFLVQATGGLRFVHPHVRQVVYAAIPAGIRAEIHGRVARFLAGEGNSPLLRAHHLWQSEVAREDALPELIAAGEWALTVMDEEGAGQAFRRALGLLPSPADHVTDPELRNAWMRVIFGLTSTLARSGSRREAKALLESARDSAAAAGWHAEAARLEITASL
jgi:eukaryotic-like serine/threonine-protein kinase